MTTIRFGTNYGGFNYPHDIHLNSSSVVYCFGAGEDISHDVQIAHKFGCDVYIFDPTPRAIEHVENIKLAYEGKKTLQPSRRYGGGDLNYTRIIMENKIDPHKIKMFNFGISNTSGTVDFFMPENPEYVSCSILQRLKGNTRFQVEMKRLREIMEFLGHTTIDLLKMDIEGAECDVIDDMLNENIYPTYLSVDFDLSVTGNKEDEDRCKLIHERLLSSGYKTVSKRGQDVSYVFCGRATS